jgi:hypothetical protein
VSRCQCYDQLAMNDGEPAGGDDQPALTMRSTDELAEVAFYFPRVAYIRGAKLHAERGRQRLDRGQLPNPGYTASLAKNEQSS